MIFNHDLLNKNESDVVRSQKVKKKSARMANLEDEQEIVQKLRQQSNLQATLFMSDAENDATIR